MCKQTDQNFGSGRGGVDKPIATPPQMYRCCGGEEVPEPLFLHWSPAPEKEKQKKKKKKNYYYGDY